MGSSHIRILAPPTSDTSVAPTVVLQCDATKYMFNAGEGTTRASAQRRMSNTKVEHIFISKVASECIGGIPGLLMTLADGGKTSLTLHGPPSLTYALATTRFYAKRSSMAVEPHQVEGGEVLKDAHVTITAVPLALRGTPPEATGEPTFKPEDTPWNDPKWSPTRLSGADAALWHTTVVKDAWGARSGSLVSRSPSRLPPPADYSPVFAYICAGHTQRGKFDISAVAEYGVPRGPAYARLAAGEDVLIDRPVGWAALDAAQRAEWLRAKKNQKCQYELEQVLIRSSDVMGSSRAGPVFFYMYLPSPEYIEPLLKEPASSQFAPYTYENNAHLPEEQRMTPHVIIHAAAKDIVEDARYQKWMASFGPACHHIIANKDHCADELVFTSSAASLLRLGRIDGRMFAMPGYSLEPAASVEESMARHGFTLGDVRAAALDQIVGLHPRTPPEILPSTAPAFNAPPGDQEAQLACIEEADQEAWDAYKQEAAKVGSVAASGASVADGLEFTTLGTGSSMPSKYRNVLSTLVHLPGDGYVLLDAGESTYGQLARRFGPGDNGWSGCGVDKILRNLRLLFVSHIHGDHHMGVARLLRERRLLNPSEPLYLVTNNYTRYYLTEYSLIEPLGLGEGVVCIDNEEILGSRNGGASCDALRKALRLSEIHTVAVNHRASHCYGVVLKHSDGWSLVFSGDTMPTDALVEAGRGASVLIHEATMEDVEAELAQAKGHSTIGQAIEIARRMEAEHVLLTHFSQRYPKLARLGATHGGTLHIGTAFDLMQAKTSDFRRMAAFRPALEMLFASDELESENGDAAVEETKDTLACAKRAKKEHVAPAASQRHTIREFDYRYVMLAFISKTPPITLPSELSVHAGVTQALEEMHGLVGGAITIDVLNVAATQNGAEAVLR
ncbi:ribonuclease Z [Malassezia cuniculi]|uniref:ribonuclease Z n=1 Tax=Malassezia cuniculi TaxID=948313 RepID=A0AAF0ET80_9BASI|nr:ribonuclease Z [Malassezia cuniculi]